MSSSGITLFISSAVSNTGAVSILFDGKKLINLLISAIHASSFDDTKWATPLVLLCVMAPPNASAVTSSPVTVFITCGPVINIWLVLSTINMKSIIAGEYTAPPAHGPIIADICGITPDAIVFL